jgi:leader peptidase (prepilin peptidase)/N-methyltransferase
MYGQDALGLGDVKLIGAGGLWLGADTIMLAMALGAMAAVVHGFFYGVLQARRTGRKPDFLNLQIPAGPGFAAGLIISGMIEFWTFRIAV